MDAKQCSCVGVTQQNFDFTSFLLHTRLAASGHGQPAYAIHRDLHVSARMDLQALFDDLALNLGWRPLRIDSVSMVLDTEELLILARGTRKPDYCSCAFEVWAHEERKAEAARVAILSRVGGALIRDPLISIDWNFLAGRGDLHSRHIEELADDVLHDEAYPAFETGVADFISRYLEAAETVLVLQGPPGTGKTRLIRGILGALARRKRRNVEVLYSADKRALETDEIFVKFLTGDCDAFVVEDADHLLRPRTDGNDHLHRFLTIADGIVRAEGRKIIFSTNLPNVGDLDDALIRPGRCFARVSTRRLSSTEAKALLTNLLGRSADHFPDSLAHVTDDGDDSFTLADLFKAVRSAAGPIHLECRSVI